MAGTAAKEMGICQQRETKINFVVEIRQIYAVVSFTEILFCFRLSNPSPRDLPPSARWMNGHLPPLSPFSLRRRLRPWILNGRSPPPPPPPPPPKRDHRAKIRPRPYVSNWANCQKRRAHTLTRRSSGKTEDDASISPPLFFHVLRSEENSAVVVFPLF